jgi:hypothetical protein
MLTHTIRSTIDTRREDDAAWASDDGPDAQQASVSADVWYHLTGRLVSSHGTSGVCAAAGDLPLVRPPDHRL